MTKHLLKNRLNGTTDRRHNKGFKDMVILMRVAALVFLILIRLFSALQISVVVIIRKIYGQYIVKTLKKLEKLD